MKDLDTLYMQQQVAHTDLPAPRAIGIDEISIRNGHNYRVIVSDLERCRPIWVGGEGRKETDLDRFFTDYWPKKSARNEQAVMDVRKPFRNSVTHNTPMPVFSSTSSKSCGTSMRPSTKCAEASIGAWWARTASSSARCLVAT